MWRHRSKAVDEIGMFIGERSYKRGTAAFMFCTAYARTCNDSSFIPSRQVQIQTVCSLSTNPVSETTQYQRDVGKTKLSTFTHVCLLRKDANANRSLRRETELQLRPARVPVRLPLKHYVGQTMPSSRGKPTTRKFSKRLYALPQ